MVRSDRPLPQKRSTKGYKYDQGRRAGENVPFEDSKVQQEHLARLKGHPFTKGKRVRSSRVKVRRVKPTPAS